MVSPPQGLPQSVFGRKVGQTTATLLIVQTTTLLAVLTKQTRLHKTNTNAFHRLTVIARPPPQGPTLLYYDPHQNSRFASTKSSHRKKYAFRHHETPILARMQTARFEKQEKLDKKAKPEKQGFHCVRTPF